MGIKNLTNLIKSKSPDSIETKGLYTLKDKIIAIDASILIYKSLTNVRSGNSYLTNKEKLSVTLLDYFIKLFYLNRLELFLSLSLMVNHQKKRKMF